LVGNDLEDSQEPGRTRRPGDLIRLQGWLAPEVVRRIFAVARGVEQLSATPGAELEEEPAFLRDPALEPPFFTEDEFLNVESGRIRFALARSPRLERLYERAFRILDGLHAELGPRLLDLLPALREAEHEGRTYHLQDTHWNARGIAVAARELARALLAHAEAAPAGAALVEPGDPRHPPGARAAAGEGGSGR
jgi:hypothetical protein